MQLRISDSCCPFHLLWTNLYRLTLAAIFKNILDYFLELNAWNSSLVEPVGPVLRISFMQKGFSGKRTRQERVWENITLFLARNLRRLFVNGGTWQRGIRAVFYYQAFFFFLPQQQILGHKSILEKK